MRLGRASALGVLATTHLADHAKGTPMQGREIAEALGVPADYVLKILQQLVKARILSSTRGPAGGFKLQKQPGKITLLAIVEAIEGPIDGAIAAADDVKGKSKAKRGMKSAYREAASLARKLLADTSVIELMETSGKAALSVKKPATH